MNKYPKNVPVCPKCEVQSGLEQCVICGRDYKLKDKRDAARAAKREAERIANLVPMKVSWPEDGIVRVYFTTRNGTSVTLRTVDLNTTGRKEWKRIFRGIHALIYEGYTGASEVIRFIKKKRYAHRTRSKSCEDFVSKDIRIWAHTVIQIEMEGQPYVHNIRYARMSNRAATRRYYKQKRDGYYGSFDTVRRCPFDWFRKYLVGCNYGD